MYPGFEIGAWYDPLLAKVVVWAPDRSQALTRMERALTEFRIAGRGVHTTIDFLVDVINDPLFQDGKHSTALVDRMTGGQGSSAPNA